MNRRNFLKNSIATLLISSLGNWDISLASTTSAWRIKPYPPTFQTGTIGLLKLKPPCQVDDIKARFGKKELLVFPTDTPKTWPYSCLVPVPLKAKAGKKIITFRAITPHDTLIYSYKLSIKKKKYPKEFLKVKKKYAEFPPAILKRVRADQAAVGKACRAVTPTIYWHGPFIKPVPGRVTSPFGLQRYFNGQPRSPHSGMDLAAPIGTPVAASNSGKVVLTRDCYLSGKTLILDHGGGLFTLYCHLSKFKANPGDITDKGQTIALSGKSGRITGPHLHWGVSLLGSRLDPQSLLDISRFLA